MATLHGKWLLTAIGNEAGWQQAVLISGSDGADGIHPMQLGTIVGPVEGAAFEVKPHAFNPATNTWIRSNERALMSYDANKGAVVTIYADDNPGPQADNDYNDLIVECAPQDPDLQPPQPDQPPIDLTIPEGAVGRHLRHPPWAR